MRVACILASRSSAGIDGGAYKNFAHDLGSRQWHRKIDVCKVEIDVLRLLALRCERRIDFAARAAMNAIRSRMWTMPAGSSSVSLKTTSRE